MDFFVKKDFDLLKKYENKQGFQKDKPYQEMLRAENVTKKWAEDIKNTIYPDVGIVKMIRKPTDQSNKYKGYTWAKIYKSKDNIEKQLAICVGINIDGFFISIDNVASKKISNYIERKNILIKKQYLQNLD